MRRVVLLWLTAKVYRGYTRYDFIQLPVLLLLVAGWVPRLTPVDFLLVLLTGAAAGKFSCSLRCAVDRHYGRSQ